MSNKTFNQNVGANNGKIGLVILAATIALLGATLSTEINALVTIKSSEVLESYDYAEFASKYQVYEDADNAIIIIEDMDKLAHYENNNKGEFVFQEYLNHEDELTINEFEDRNEYNN